MLVILLFVNSESAASGRQMGNSAEPLLLDVSVNTRPIPEIVRAEKLADGRLALPVEVWQAARLQPPPSEPLTLSDNQRGYALESAPGLTYILDRDRLTLAITAAAAAFQGSVYDSDQGSVYDSDHGGASASGPSPPNLSPLGAYLDYDLSVASVAGGDSNYGGLFNGVLFNGWGSAVSGMLLRGDGETGEGVRTETFWRKDFPGPMETLVVGDAIGSGGAWSRPARYGGIRWGRDFSLRPGFVAMPMPSISGSAALPSSVDVLINNQRQRSEQVDPGPFELTNVPVASGAGEINLIVRDLLGRETVVAQSYYLSPKLLAAGLSDYSLEAGFLRENYGSENADYGDSFAATTWRCGLTSALTGEARLELQQARQAAGVDLIGLAGNLAAVEASASAADADGLRGAHYLLGLERSSKSGSGSLRWESFDRNFTPFAFASGESRPRERYSANLGLRIFDAMSAGINYTQQQTWEDERFSMGAVSLGATLPWWNMYLGAYANQRLDGEGDWACGLRLSMPLGGQRATSLASNRSNNGRLTNTAEASQSPPSSTGLGWQVRASDDTNQQWQGGVTWNANSGVFTAEASDTATNPALRLGAGGSIGLLGGHSFVARPIGAGSFSVVKVADLEGVPVYRSNQPVAVTDADGQALVAGLLPYYENQLSINPAELPFDVEIGSVKEMVLPYARSGLLVEFPVRRSRNAVAVLHLPDGSPMPVGTEVRTSPGNRVFLVGHRGEVYLQDLADSNRLMVESPEGACTLDFPLDPKGPSEPRIGPLTCGGQP